MNLHEKHGGSWAVYGRYNNMNRGSSLQILVYKPVHSYLYYCLTWLLLHWIPQEHQYFSSALWFYALIEIINNYTIPCER